LAEVLKDRVKREGLIYDRRARFDRRQSPGPKAADLATERDDEATDWPLTWAINHGLMIRPSSYKGRRKRMVTFDSSGLSWP